MGPNKNLAIWAELPRVPLGKTLKAVNKRKAQKILHKKPLFLGKLAKEREEAI